MRPAPALATRPAGVSSRRAGGPALTPGQGSRTAQWRRRMRRVNNAAAAPITRLNMKAATASIAA